jgi:hypothetical protein
VPEARHHRLATADVPLELSVREVEEARLDHLEGGARPERRSELTRGADDRAYARDALREFVEHARPRAARAAEQEGGRLRATRG